MKHKLRLAALATAVALAFAPVGNSIVPPKRPPRRTPAPRPCTRPCWPSPTSITTPAPRFEPIGATENGDNRFDDQLGMSIAPAKARAAIQAVPASSKPA